MRRISSALVGIFIILTGVSLSASAMAMNNTCSNGFPAPYTGGAGVAEFFHLSDGSTVTVTDTGAVIKQSPCHTAYREGWINTSDICNIKSAQDLNGRLGSGSSNPFSSARFTSCPSNVQTPAKTSASTSTGPTATANATATVNVTTTPAVKAATTTVSQPAAAVTTLPNTGPGNILMLSGATTAVGTIGHLIYSRRKRIDR